MLAVGTVAGSSRTGSVIGGRDIGFIHSPVSGFRSTRADIAPEMPVPALRAGTRNGVAFLRPVPPEARATGPFSARTCNSDPNRTCVAD